MRRVLNVSVPHVWTGTVPGIIAGEIWMVPGIFAADESNSGRLLVFLCHTNLFLGELLRKKAAADAQVPLIGLCTGSFILARAGLLKC